MRHKLFLAGLIAFPALFVGTAQACTCPPYENAADHASRFDFVALGRVDIVYPLQDPDLNARFDYEQAYNEALTLYVLDHQSGDDTRTLREFEDAYTAENPPPVIQSFGGGGGTMTRLTVSEVLKGEDTDEVFIGSPPAGPPLCGINYRPETDVVILANTSDGRYGAWMCSIPMFTPEAYEAALSTPTPEDENPTD